MSTIQTAFRLRVYEPRSVHSAEDTVLTPRTGAPHSDAFQVASIYGVSGYKPYLEPPTGRRGRFDPLTRKRDIGSLSVRILDKRTSTGNASRWLTAFVGTLAGKNQLLGLKAQLDISTDGGTNWTAFYTGRIHQIAFHGEGYGLIWSLSIREASSDLDFEIFGARPHGSATEATPTQLWPIAPSTVEYGPWGATARRVPMVVTKTNAVSMRLGVNFTSSFDVSWLTKSDALTSRASSAYGVTSPKRARVRCVFTSGALNGETREYWLGAIFAGSTSEKHIVTVECLPIDAAETANYAATQAAGVTANVSVHAYDADEAAPLWIDDVHPVTLLAHILSGYYGYLAANGTDVSRSYPYDSTSFTALAADGTIPNARFPIDKKWKALDFIEQQILVPFGLGYRLNGSGEVVVFDARTPNSLAGLATLAETDVEAGGVSWEQTREGAITRLDITTYEDWTPGTTQGLMQGSSYGGRPALIESFDRVTVVAAFGDTDTGDRAHKIDARGLRTTPFPNDTVGLLPRSSWLPQYVNALAEDLRRPWATGPSYIRARLRRTATVNALTEGALVLVAMDAVPDPTSVVRGGTRLCRVTEFSDVGLAVDAQLLDLGRNAAAAAPTVGALDVDASDESHLVTVPITLGADSDPVEIWVNVTATSVGSRPADTAAGWTLWQRAITSATYTVRAPSGKRVWVRARSVPTTNEKIAGAWVYPSTYSHTDYQDTDALTAPSDVAATAIYSKSADITWTVGSALALTEISLDGFTTRLMLLPAGTTRTTLTGLTASTNYTASVRHVDPDGGGVSATATGAFSTTDTANTCPAMTGIQVLVGA